MAKLNIIKPTGNEAFNLVSAFKENNETYVIFDSERIGSMGLPIIYISKYTDKLEKITDESEWQNVKNYLKGIINGTNYNYVKMNDTLNADEVYYTPLTLPEASFNVIKSSYVVSDNTSAEVLAPAEPTIGTVPPVEPIPEVINNVAPVAPEVQPVNPVPPVDVVAPTTPVAPVAPAINDIPDIISPATEPSIPEPVVAPNNLNTMNNEIEELFIKEKETFLKACENMFDALVSKYEKKLNDIETRENEVIKKEQEIENKLQNANEHLANAEAREQVANIAHDNAQKIMDISNFMPNNPNAN